MGKRPNRSLPSILYRPRRIMEMEAVAAAAAAATAAAEKAKKEQLEKVFVHFLTFSFYFN